MTGLPEGAVTCTERRNGKSFPVSPVMSLLAGIRRDHDVRDHCS
jgi:hypothetical protein